LPLRITGRMLISRLRTHTAADIALRLSWPSGRINERTDDSAFYGGIPELRVRRRRPLAASLRTDARFVRLLKK